MRATRLSRAPVIARSTAATGGGGLRDRLGQNVIVESCAGASGSAAYGIKSE